MIEFTISRVVLCACGIILMVSVSGVLSGIYDKDADLMDEDLAERFAYMLDVFQSSDDDTLVLNGSMLLPEGYTAHIHDGFVELFHNDRRSMAMTEYLGEFVLGCNDTETVIHQRSLLSS